MEPTKNEESPIDYTHLEVNKKVELIVDDTLKFNATIHNKEEKKLELYTYEEARSLNLGAGDQLKYCLCLLDDFSTDFYSCYSKVLKIKDFNNGLSIGISYPHRIEKLGIRKFYRLDIQMPVRYRLINILDQYDKLSDVPQIYSLRMRDAVTDNLSGNGIRIVTEEICRKGQQILLELPDFNQMKLLGVIEWIEPDKLTNTVKVAISFKNIKEGDQDKIILFIFDTMRGTRTRL